MKVKFAQLLSTSLFCVYLAFWFIGGGCTCAQDDAIAVEQEGAQDVVQVQVDIEGIMIEPAAAQQIGFGQIGFALIDDVGIGGRNAVIKRVINDIRPVIRSELYFLTLVVDFSQDKKAELKEAIEKRLNDIAESMVAKEPNNGAFQVMAQGNVVAMTSSGISLSKNPYSLIRDEIAKAAGNILSNEEIEKYRLELEKREQFKKQANISMVVQMLDNRLLLSMEQREQIEANLLEKWSSVGLLSLETYLNNPNYVPAIPFPLIDKVLDRNQRTVWNSLNQHNFPLQLVVQQVDLGLGF